MTVPHEHAAALCPTVKRMSVHDVSSASVKNCLTPGLKKLVWIALKTKASNHKKQTQTNSHVSDTPKQPKHMSSLPGTFSLQTAVRTFGLANEIEVGCFPSASADDPRHRILVAVRCSTASVVERSSAQFNSQHKFIFNLRWLQWAKHHTLKCISMLPHAATVRMVFH